MRRRIIAAVLILIAACVLTIAVASCGKKPAPSRMVRIPGGRFDADGLPYEMGLHPVREMEINSFFIEVTEVTVAQYKQCVRAGKCGRRRGAIPAALNHPEQPAVMITQKDAAAYCAYVGGRLPTEWEWEKAAKGPKGMRYPYGDRFRADAANTAYASMRSVNDRSYRFAAPPGSYKEDLSGYGVMDMGGNVAEWTSSTSPSGEVVVRGGHWYSEKAQSANYYREFVPTGDLMSNTVGFRCAKDAG